MIFCKVDCNITDHPKFADAGIAATGLWLLGLAYSRKHELDGRIPKSALRSWGEQGEAIGVASVLLRVGLWIDGGEHFIIWGYDKRNQTRAEIEAARALSRERKQIWREARTTAGAPQNDVVSRMCPSVPPDQRPAVVPISSSSSISNSLSGESAREGADEPEATGAGLPPILAAVAERQAEGVDLTKEQRRALTVERYRGAYERGIAAGKGSPFALVLKPRSETALVAGVVQHARAAADGKAFRGDRLVQWIESQARQFAQAVRGLPPSEAKFWDSHDPARWLEWLNKTPVAAPEPTTAARPRPGPKDAPAPDLGAATDLSERVSPDAIRALTAALGNGGAP